MARTVAAGLGRRCASPSACIRTRRTSSPPTRRRRPRRWRPGSTRRRWCARSARSGSTTTTTSRRARCSRRSSARSSRLAQARRLPVVIHTREAEADTLALIAEAQAARAAGRRVPLLHRRTRGRGRRALATGFYLSFAGIVTFPRAVELRDALRRGPARSAAGRDRRPLSGAGAAPRPAQRAGVGDDHGWRPWPASGACTDEALAAAVRDNYDRLFAARGPQISPAQGLSAPSPR